MLEINHNRAPEPIETIKVDAPQHTRQAQNLLMKVLSIYLLYATLVSWAQVSGIIAGHPGGFDTMPVHWRFMIVLLCVAQPVAALGLWGLFSWGVVVWLMVAVSQILMYTAFADLFGNNLKLVFWHVCCLLVFAILTLPKRFMPNKK